jgi:hypothetical protein
MAYIKLALDRELRMKYALRNRVWVMHEAVE